MGGVDGLEEFAAFVGGLVEKSFVWEAPFFGECPLWTIAKNADVAGAGVSACFGTVREAVDEENGIACVEINGLCSDDVVHGVGADIEVKLWMLNVGFVTARDDNSGAVAGADVVVCRITLICPQRNSPL